MHPKTLLIALLLTAVPLLQCQAQTQPGYIITLNGDTLNGLLENTGEVRNSQICQFQGSGQSEAVEYLPGAISGYGFSEGSYYESKTIVLDGSEQLVFAQCLVKGAASLFYYRNAAGKFYFLDKEESEMLGLTKENNRYIRLLKASFSDCMEIQASIDKVSLSHRSLISITCKYNDCVGKGEGSVTYKQGSRFRLGLGPVIGFSFNNYKTVGEEPYNSLDFENSIDPELGLLLNLSSGSQGNHLSFQLGSTLSKSSFHAYYETEPLIYSGRYHSYDIELESLSVKISGEAKYSFTSNRLRPSLGGGLMIQKFIQPDFLYIDQAHFVDLVTLEKWYTERDLYLDIPRTWFYGIYLQAGVDMDLTQKILLFANIRGGILTTDSHTIAELDGNVIQMGRIRSELISIGFNLGILF
jgi:hypothetical protein